MVKERQDITGSNCLKGVSGKVIVDEKGIKDLWKEYMEKLMNEENERDHRILATAKEGPADCIRIDEALAPWGSWWELKGRKKSLTWADHLENFVGYMFTYAFYTQEQQIITELSAQMSNYTVQKLCLKGGGSGENKTLTGRGAWFHLE